jgi:hypothetical protein
MIPSRPDEESSTQEAAAEPASEVLSGGAASATAEEPGGDGSAALASRPGATSDPAQAPDALASQASGPAMMVFGPLLAVSALEYLFLGDEILQLVAAVFT